VLCENSIFTYSFDSLFSKPENSPRQNLGNTSVQLQETNVRELFKVVASGGGIAALSCGSGEGISDEMIVAGQLYHHHCNGTTFVTTSL
jgi:hypothetical protein